VKEQKQAYEIIAPSVRVGVSMLSVSLQLLNQLAIIQDVLSAEVYYNSILFKLLAISNNYKLETRICEVGDTSNKFSVKVKQY
jgi:hypothetical protein